VRRMDATRLKHVELFGGEGAGAIVSGIPLLLMPAKSVIALLEGAFERLRSDGAFYQFTYGRNIPIARPILDRMGLKATRIGGTLANLPPASVYRIRRRPSRVMALRRAGTRPMPAPANAPVYATPLEFESILRSRMRPPEG
jgi:phosphatidylethanolamine/phosphatidyl-N-methylethanolamine N-methyltransferase